MGHELNDLLQHHRWATAQLLTYCQGLDDATLHATVPGTYGTIIETLQHLVDSEGSYVRRLTKVADHPWKGDRAVGLETLAERNAILAESSRSSWRGSGIARPRAKRTATRARRTGSGRVSS